MNQKHLWIPWISLLMLFAGCGNDPVTSSGKTETGPVSVFGNAETVSVDVAHSGKTFSDSVKIEPGHWEKTAELFSGPVALNGGAGEALQKSSNTKEKMVFSVTTADGKPYEYIVNSGSIKDTYLAGEECYPRIWVSRTGRKSKAPPHLYGSLYFADVEKGDDPFGQSVTIRQYLRFRNGSEERRLLMNHYGMADIEVKSGNSQQDFSYDPAAFLPRLVKEGDKICLVFDVTEEESGIAMRRIWEFTWVKDSVAQETVQPEEEDHSDSGWMKNVYSGHWDLCDIRYVSEEHEPQKESGMTITAERKGVDGQDMRYVFEKDGERLALTIPELKFASRYYAGDPFFKEVEIYADSQSEMAVIDCSLAIGRTEFNEETGMVKVNPEIYFGNGYPRKEIEVFGPIPHDATMRWWNNIMRAYLMLETEFPEGKEDGDKICIVFGVMDDETHKYRMFNIYEYVWTKGPDEVWTYNPPMY